MAKITAKNEYELVARRLKVLQKKKNPDENLVEKLGNALEELKTRQDNQVILGGLCRIQYRFYEHDPFPLALFFSQPRQDIISVQLLIYII